MLVGLCLGSSQSSSTWQFLQAKSPIEFRTKAVFHMLGPEPRVEGFVCWVSSRSIW